ncbi:hypothetical protein K474DRAFT_793833 [Panus rudis PR-1116 ss-1]|nr:hypothetical protein K474DRAFT_793833 [Panus rudis PR-1116 ss-1]
MYATEMLCGSVAVAHAINAVFFDDVMHAWWYDREGAIQCSGISFVKDLPRFLAFLFALQHLPLTKWRVAHELDSLIQYRLTNEFSTAKKGEEDAAEVNHYGPVKTISIGNVTITLDPRSQFNLHKGYCLGTRATRSIFRIISCSKSTGRTRLVNRRLTS